MLLSSTLKKITTPSSRSNSLQTFPKIWCNEYPTFTWLTTVWRLQKLSWSIWKLLRNCHFTGSSVILLAKLTVFRLHQFHVRDAENTDLVLACHFGGIYIMQNSKSNPFSIVSIWFLAILLNRFAWPTIIELSYKRDIFYVKVRAGIVNNLETKIGFICPSTGLFLHKIVSQMANLRSGEANLADWNRPSSLFPRWNDAKYNQGPKIPANAGRTHRPSRQAQGRPPLSPSSTSP